ncbi:hypothetical protein PIB30_074714 [Stylosanthes scabra]|uniref:Uncharacterized protein n=1 Tax=Stylosanthes scabra TaxID=79078 RepID=A0ABU6RQ22_9FABA|nr:hypothetical protein [Stylosanthes scabra]
MEIMQPPITNVQLKDTKQKSKVGDNPPWLHKQPLISARVAWCCTRNEHSGSLGFCLKTELRAQLHVMDRKRNQATLKGKEELRAPPTRMSPRLAALRAPHFPPLKMRTPPSRASPRLAALKDSPLPPSPTSVLMPKKLRTARISVKPVWLQFPERVIAKRGPSIAATKEKVIINDSSDSETSKKVEDDNMELIAMDEPFVQVEEVEEEEEEEEEEEDPEEDPEEEEEGEVEYFRDEEDYEDYFSEEDDDSSDGSTGSN